MTISRDWRRRLGIFVAVLLMAALYPIVQWQRIPSLSGYQHL